MKDIYTRLRWMFWSLIIILAAGCSVTEEDLIDYGKDRQFDKLIRYIEENQEDTEKVKLVQLAATQLFKDEDPYSWHKGARYRYLNKLEPELVRYSLLVISDKGAATFLQRAVTERLQAANYWDYRETVKLMSWAVELDLEPRDRLQTIHSAVVRIVDLNSKLDSLESERRRLDNVINAILEKSAEDTLWMRQYHPVEISGYIRGQQEKGVYEVVINRKSALLIATETRFTGTGNFRLFATELAETPVSLTREYGGFTQMWKVYREVPKSELDSRFEHGKQILERLLKPQTSLISKRGDLQRMDKEISEIERELETHIEQANRIILFDVSYGGAGQ